MYKISRVDIIGQNGNEGLHYEEMDILERLKAQPKVNGAYLRDIEDAIIEIEWLRQEVASLLAKKGSQN